MPRPLPRALPLLCGMLLAGSAGAQATTVRPVWPDEGPIRWTQRATVPGITANDLRTRLYQFADDSMEGRLIGTRGNYKGTAYIGREFARIGLRPGGERGTYFQIMPFGPAVFDRASARLVAGGAPLEPVRDWVPVVPTARNGYSGTADLADVPALFAGTWGDSTPLDPTEFRGKVAVFVAPAFAAGLAGRSVAPEARCDSLPDRFGAEAAVKWEEEQRAEGLSRPRMLPLVDRRAARAGAVAVLLVSLDSATPALVEGAFAPHDIMRPGAPPQGAPAAAALSVAAAARLFGRPVNELSVGARGAPVSAHWSYRWRMSPTPARNVIGIIPGSDPARAGEYVLISAHNDHVGMLRVAVDHDSLRAVNIVTRRQGANDPVCRPTPAQRHEIDSLIARARRIRPPRRDSIMNGADDDGSGTVILLEIAERMAHEHPARSIVFVSHDGEEAGLLGSQWFTSHPTIPLDSVAAALNMDMESKGRADQVKFGGPSSIQMLGSRRLSTEFGDIIDSVNAVRPHAMAVDRSWDVPANPLNRFCRSDQVNYVLHAVPVTYFSTGYSEDYHQPTDEPEYADYDHMARVGRFVHDIAWAIAEHAHRPVVDGPNPAYPSCR